MKEQIGHGHKEAMAVLALMGWLTSRDEVTGPFSARHEAGQAARLADQFCKAQGWHIDEKRFAEDIRKLKQHYPDTMFKDDGSSSKTV